MIEIKARAILAGLFGVLLVSVLGFEAGYQICDLKKRHLVEVQEITERQDGILEDCEEFRWRLDSLEVHDGVRGAEIKSLKNRWLESQGGRLNAVKD